jgi:large subunit ribosomal protein L23
MRASQILVKPILTEKANAQQDSLRSYTFKVAQAANKLEIKSAIEAFYGVKVEEVNTLRVPAKSKVRQTKSGLLKGRKQGYKKAIVKLAENEVIDLYEGNN